MANEDPEGVHLARFIEEKLFGQHNDDMGLPPVFKTQQEQTRIRFILNMSVPDWLLTATTGRWQWASVTTTELALVNTYGDFVVLCYKHLRSLTPVVPAALAASLSEQAFSDTRRMLDDAIENSSVSLRKAHKSLGTFANMIRRKAVK